MAMSLNRVELIGNLTRDPELKQASGNSVATFSIATNMTWTDQSGQKQSKSEFHNLVAWRKLADICGQYLKKGMKIYAEGRLQTRDWEGEDGVKRYRTEIVLDNMIMLGGRTDSEETKTFEKKEKMDSKKVVHFPRQKQEVLAEELAIDDLPF